MRLHEYASDLHLFDRFRTDCGRCCGLCCVALYFSKFDGFPTDKTAGVPCPNLNGNFQCRIHRELPHRGMKGCLAYDCGGSGQLVTALYQGKTWSSHPHLAREMFEVFISVHQLWQASWYLTETLTLLPARPLWAQACEYQRQLDTVMQSRPAEILQFEPDELMKNVVLLLKQVGVLVSRQTTPAMQTQKKAKNISRKKEFMGYHFKQSDLSGHDFSSSLLIAANLESCCLSGCNFLGADLRDAALSGADLSESIYLTQGQLNAARGNRRTRIPAHLNRPRTWD